MHLREVKLIRLYPAINGSGTHARDRAGLVYRDHPDAATALRTPDHSRQLWFADHNDPFGLDGNLCPLCFHSASVSTDKVSVETLIVFSVSPHSDQPHGASGENRPRRVTFATSLALR